jgi:hypothetical protein
MRCLPSERRAKPAGEWNHYRVECNDSSIKLAVNGKVVSGASKCHPRKGYVCLESEGGECHFRNIRIKELPSTDPKPDDVAKADQGFKSIYTGIDLSGWNVDDAAKDHWKAKDWTLVYDGKAEAQPKPIWTEAKYADFELVVDWRVTDKNAPAAAGAKLGLGASDTALLSMARPAGGGGDPAARKVGEWNRSVVKVRNRVATLTLNGEAVPERITVTGLSARGPVGLAADAPAEFANLYVRELP